MGERWESELGEGGARRIRRGGGLGHVIGRRPRYRLDVEVTSPSPDCRGWHFRSLPHLFSSSLQ